MSESRLTHGLAPPVLHHLHDAFRRFPEVEQVLIFGSRARGTARSGADIDLAVRAPKLDSTAFAGLHQALDDLPLLYKLDLIHLDTLADPVLMRKIQHDGQVLYQR